MMAKKFDTIKLIVCGYITFFLIAYFDEFKLEITNSLSLWAGVLIPSLFPYLVMSQYITSGKLPNIFYPLEKCVSKIFNLSKCSASVYLCSLVCGYPSGAVCSRELYDSGRIKASECERLICFTNNAGPLFLISAVGSHMLSSTSDGIAIYVIQTLSAAIIGLITGIKSQKIKECGKEHIKCGTSLISCCESSVSIMLKICGYLIVSATLGRIVLLSIEKFAKPLADIPYTEAIVYFVLEISNAMNVLSCLEASVVNFALICACASWAGISVIMQIKSASPDFVSVKKIIRRKLFQSIISFGLGYGYKHINSTDISGIWNIQALKLSVIVSILIFAIYVIYSYKKTACE